MQALDAVRAGGEEAERQVAALTRLAVHAATRQAEAAAGLPACRRAEAEAVAALQQLITARQQLDAEEGRIDQAKRDLDLRLDQIATDLRREGARAADAEQALARMAEERTVLLSACADETGRQDEAGRAVDEVLAETTQLEGELNRLLEEVAAADADRAAALRALGEAEVRRDRLARRSDEMTEQRVRAATDAVDRAVLTSAEMDLEEAAEHLAICQERAEGAERRRTEAQTARERARDLWQTIAPHGPSWMPRPAH